MYRIERYNSSYYDTWNNFVSGSKNGTFLFHRDFMEYHSDRFDDFSLIVFEGDNPVALLPAHKKESEVQSHMGLTYGGLVYGPKLKQVSVIAIFRTLLEYLNNIGIQKLFLKMIPPIYHKLPAQEQEYALFLAGAKLVRRDSLSVIQYENKLPYAKTRKECIRRGIKQELTIVEEPNFELFWNEILLPNLDAKHDAKPVHTVAEIEYLHSRFPENIRHFNVYHEGRIVAGTTMFLTDTVAHPQYVSGQKDKNELGSLDYLYSHLIDLFAGKKYFDFGISNEQQGTKLNEGLIFWKESFGARTIVQDFYEVPTGNFTLLDNVLI